MIKSLRQIGNSYGFIIDRPIMELLGIDKNTQLEVSTQDGSLILRPIKPATDHKSRVRQSAARMGSVHHDALKELAE